MIQSLTIRKFEESGCLQVAIEGRIADLLAEKPDGIHIGELSSRTGIDVDKLGRILRLLASRHIFAESEFP